MEENDPSVALKATIQLMARRLEDIPFNLVIEALAGCQVLPFDSAANPDKATLRRLGMAAERAAQTFNRTGIIRDRANEVGNDVEAFVKRALVAVGFPDAAKPTTRSGSVKTTGYPDLVFTAGGGKTVYLECKTYNVKSLASTQRSFYLSPSEDFKVTRSAAHLALCYEVYEDGKSGGQNVYRAKRWKILSLENLRVDVKYEFNADNRRLYAKRLILSEGPC